MWCIGYNFLHHIFNFRQLVHQIHFVVQPTGGIDNNHISIVGFCRSQGIIGHRSRIRAHFLFDDRHAGTLTPNHQLLYRSSPESIGSAQIHFFSGLCELISQFTDSCCFTNAIDTHHHDYIRFIGQRAIKIHWHIRVIFGKQSGNFFFQNTVQLRCTHIFIPCHTFFDATNNA